MKHHFGDLLDREGGYWTIVPNRERYAYTIGDLPPDSKEITILTIGKDEKHWERVFTFPNLEELTLHEPFKEQLERISELTTVKRLRITHARPKNIEFISNLVNVEELILEYVSGFSDLSPLKSLTKLKSLHMENLRRVKNFEGISGMESLRYLHIDGTLDWKQPIENFDFLAGLPSLEVLSLGGIINKTSYPALLSAIHLKKLKKLKLSWNQLAAEEYALLEVCLPEVEGADRGPFTRFAYSRIPLPKDDLRSKLADDVIKSNHPEVLINYKGERLINDPTDEWFEFTGKGAGKVKCTSPKAQQKCDEYATKYLAMKQEAEKVIKQR